MYYWAKNYCQKLDFPLLVYQVLGGVRTLFIVQCTFVLVIVNTFYVFSIYL